MNTPSAPSTPQSLGSDDPASAAVLRAATTPLDEAVGARVRVDVNALYRAGSWVFLKGTMRGADGGRPDFAGTAYAARRADGAMSDVYVALLHKADDAGPDGEARSWTVSDYAVGPTDVAWLTWADKHGAPRGVFAF